MKTATFTIIIPEAGKTEQGKEKFFVEYQGRTRPLFTHDYQEIYRVPGLYEALFHNRLKCCSPHVVTG